MPRVFLVLLALGLALTATPATAGNARSPDKPRVHVVQRGQTLGMIAKRYHVSIAALRRANDIRRSRDLKPKARLVIPERSDKDGSRARAMRHAADQSSTNAAAAKTGTTAKAPSPEDYARKPRHPGYVILHSTVGAWRGYALRKGKVPQAAEHNISRVLASWRSRQKLAINERLIRMIATVSDHFGGRPIRVVSGFRPYRPTQYTPHSQHNLGHAMDFSIPGVPNAAVRDFCRTLPKVGCGYYPNSSFVHMDVRDVSTYWVDFAGPGEAPRYATGKGTDPGRADREAAETEHEPEHLAPAAGTEHAPEHPAPAAGTEHGPEHPAPAAAAGGQSGKPAADRADESSKTRPAKGKNSGDT